MKKEQEVQLQNGVQVKEKKKKKKEKKKKKKKKKKGEGKKGELVDDKHRVKSMAQGEEEEGMEEEEVSKKYSLSCCLSFLSLSNPKLRVWSFYLLEVENDRERAGTVVESESCCCGRGARGAVGEVRGGAGARAAGGGR